jgi:MFS family permease
VNARTAVAATFLGHAAIVGTWASRVPAIKHSLGITDTQLGLALFGMALGTVAGSRIGGALARRLGPRLCVIAGVPVMGASLVLAPLAGNLAELTAALVAFGAILAVVDVSMNTEAVVVEQAYGRPLMSGLHGMWSVGLLLGSAAGAAAAGLDIRPVVQFALAAAVVAGATLPLLRGLPSRPPVAIREGRRRGGWSVALVVLGLISFCSFFAEGAVIDWAAVYVHDRGAASAAMAAVALASFSLSMAVSRLAGDRLAMRLGPVRLTRSFSMLAAAGFALALLVPGAPAGIVGFGLVGIGLAPIVPTAVSAAGNSNLGDPETVVSRIFMISYFGSIIGPALIGFVAGHTALRGALLIPMALVAFIIVASSRLSAAAGGEKRVAESGVSAQRAGA